MTFPKTSRMPGLLFLAVFLPGLQAEALIPKATPGAKPPAVEEPQAKPPESLSYGRFGPVAIYRSAPHPKNVVLFLSGDGGWNLGVVDMARILSSMDSLVVGINVPQYMKKLNASKESCVYPASDLELLSKFVQKTFGFPTYVPPVLVGYSSGATLAYAVLAQAPPNTYRGAISLGFCPDLDSKHPFCSGHGIASGPGLKNKGLIFKPTSTSKRLGSRFRGRSIRFATRTTRCATCHRSRTARSSSCPTWDMVFPRPTNGSRSFGRRISRSGQDARPARRARREPALSRRGAGAGRGSRRQRSAARRSSGQRRAASALMAVVISGDGGWAGLDKEVAGALAAKGIPVVGVNSLQYFWTARTPDGIARDLERILRRYLALWNRQEVMLIGYSLVPTCCLSRRTGCRRIFEAR